MPIQIIDNFDLGSPKPIDNRLVVGSQSFYPNKDSITHKYPGLRVWDLDLGIPFVWTGTTFSSENTTAITGNGIGGYLPKYILNNVIGNSVVYDDGLGNIGINTSTPLYQLDILGQLRATVLRGQGQFISQINASNITLGNLSLNRLTSGSLGQILVAGPSQPEWTSPSNITVGTASGVVVVNDTGSGTTHYPLFVSAITGSAQTKVSSSRFQFTPSTGNLFMSGSLGVNTTAGPERLRVAGNVLLTTGNLTVFDGKFRLNKSGTDVFEIGYNSSSDNFVVEANSNSTKLKLINPTTPANFTELTQYQTWTELLTNGRGYINVANSGNERMITFGRAGGNDQIRFIMDTSVTESVPVIGGKGVYVMYNHRVNGISSATKFDLMDDTIVNVSLTFTGLPPTATTSVLSADTTVYFWFSTATSALTIEVETAFASGVYSLIYSSSDGVTNSKTGSVIVPKGCRVRLTRASSGAATAYYRKFGVD